MLSIRRAVGMRPAAGSERKHRLSAALAAAQHSELSTSIQRSELLILCRAAVRPHDGADYIINMGGRVPPALLSLVPAYSNVRVRLVEHETAHSDTCTFYRTLLEQGVSRLSFWF